MASISYGRCDVRCGAVEVELLGAMDVYLGVMFSSDMGVPENPPGLTFGVGYHSIIV